MNISRPFVLTIAAFDPSGGAGVTADIKTFEGCKVYGMGAVTGITFQNDMEFEDVKWIKTEEIIRQINILTKKFRFEFIKIGMIKDLETLDCIIENCKSQIANCKLILDPILKTSSGFEIHKNLQKDKLISLLKTIFLITPNTDEITILAGERDEMKAAKKLSAFCNVLLKGGHSQKAKGTDYLFLKNGKLHQLAPKKPFSNSKHGTGCVLSSAITANLARGYGLVNACRYAKDYVTKFLLSNNSLLGYHFI